MKKFVSLILLCAAVTLILPVIFLESSESSAKTILQAETTSESIEEPTENPDTIKVFRSISEENVEIDFFEYVCGSVAAEMPLSYHEEALKAQAVACFTNALRLKTNAEKAKESHISDDSSIHQGYLNEDERKEKWGDDFEKYENKLQGVVKEVENEALYYNDELCVAAFHAICSGKTEAAKNVWGEDIPYLESVKSHGDNLSPQFSSSVSVDKDNFIKCAEKLGIKTNKIASLKGIMKITKKSDAGTILKATISGEDFSGEEIRKAFSLRSSVFSIKTSKSSVTFNVSGYGHGVGMSQYGADFMARQGSSYDEILYHYYKGTQILTTNNKTESAGTV